MDRGGDGTRPRRSSPSHPNWNKCIKFSIHQPFTFETDLPIRSLNTENKLLTNGGIPRLW